MFDSSQREAEGAGLQLCKDCKTNFLDTVTLQKVSGDEIKFHQMKTADISLTHLIINFLFYAAAVPSGGAVPHLPLMQRRHCTGLFMVLSEAQAAEVGTVCVCVSNLVTVWKYVYVLFT